MRDTNRLEFDEPTVLCEKTYDDASIKCIGKLSDG